MNQVLPFETSSDQRCFALSILLLLLLLLLLWGAFFFFFSVVFVFVFGLVWVILVVVVFVVVVVLLFWNCQLPRVYFQFELAYIMSGQHDQPIPTYLGQGS